VVGRLRAVIQEDRAEAARIRDALVSFEREKRADRRHGRKRERLNRQFPGWKTPFRQQLQSMPTPIIVVGFGGGSSSEKAHIVPLRRIRISRFSRSAFRTSLRDS
jgi:hypothetical protein